MDNSILKSYLYSTIKSMDRIKDRMKSDRILLLRYVYLSKTSKMPCYSWSTPIETCPIGSILRKIEGTPCSVCYADGFLYQLDNARYVRHRNLLSYLNNRNQWIADITLKIDSTFLDIFRWFDSGDIIDEQMFIDICQVAKNLPHILFWLPTQQLNFVSKHLDKIPDNLMVRISSTKINKYRKLSISHPNVGVSMVYTEETKAFTEICKAQFNKKKCGRCRMCWDKEIKNISYPLH